MRRYSLAGLSGRLIVALSLTLAALCVPQAASAQSVFTASKKICAGDPAMGVDPATCPTAAIVAGGQPVFYTITVTNPFGSDGQTINLTEHYPQWFLQSGAIICTDDQGNNVPVTGTAIGSFFLAPNRTVTCIVKGSFDANAPTGVTQVNTVDIDNGVIPVDQEQAVTHVNHDAPLGSNISILKTASPATVTAPGIVTFTVTITNNGPNDATIGHFFQLHDTLALLPQSVPLYAQLQTGSGTWSCNATTGTNCLDPSGPTASGTTFIPTMAPVDFMHWGFANDTDIIRAGGVITLTYQVKIKAVPGLGCYQALNADGLKNTVFFTLTNTDGSAASDSYAPDNTSSAVVHVNTGATQQDPDCGKGQLSIKKVQNTLPNPRPWSPPSGAGTVSYTITIKNTSTPAQLIKILPTDLQDLVTEGVGTPPFTRKFVSATCSSFPVGICAGFAGSPPALPVPNTFHYSYYDETEKAWETKPGSPQLIIPHVPNNHVIITIKFDYSDPDCQTVPNVTPKPIVNTALVNYHATPLGQSSPMIAYTQTASVITTMEPPHACQFRVKKKVAESKVRFGSMMHYKVSFQNNDAARTIATVADFIRIDVGNYSVGLPYSANWTCSQTGGVTGFTATGSIAAGTIVHTTSPAQGAIVMQQPPTIFFAHGAILSCNINVTIQRPSFDDPYCSASDAFAENAALMDVTNPFNPSYPWPPSGTYAGGLSNPAPQTENWATVKSPLPKCYNVILNKTASANGMTPAWTYGPNGPDIDYAVTVTNVGTSGSIDDVGSWSGLQITDHLTPSHLVSQGTPNYCTQTQSGPTWCTPRPPPLATTADQHIGIHHLDFGNSGTWNLALQQPFPTAPPQTIYHNCVSLAPVGPEFEGSDWYSHDDPAHPPAPVCVNVPVLEVAPLTIVKHVVNLTPATLSGTQQFPISVSCSNYPIPATTVSPQAGASATVNNVPVGDSCTLTESALAIPLNVQQACNGSAAWDTPPNYSPSNPVVIASGGTTVTVTNTIRCTSVPTGTLTVEKDVNNQTGGALPANTTFPINVTCMPGNVQWNFSLADLGSNVLTAALGNCQVSEIPVSGTFVDPNCPSGTAQWTNVGFQPNAIALLTTTHPNRTVTVMNKVTCAVNTPGSLTVLKTVVNATGGPILGITNPSFPIAVQCPAGTATDSYSLNDGGTHTTNNIAGGANCKVVETVPPHFVDPSCAAFAAWDTPPLYTPSQTVPVPGGGTASVAVTNTLRCEGVITTDVDWVKVTKTANVVGGGDFLPTLQAAGISVNVQLVCTAPNGTSHTTTLTLGPGNYNHQYWSTLNNQTPGTTCVITEQTPPSLANIQGGPCTWTLPPPQTITLQSTETDVTIANYVTCNSNPNTNVLTIEKDVYYAALADPDTTFIFDVSCTGPGNTPPYSSQVSIPYIWPQNGTVVNGMDQQQLFVTATNVPVGASCQVTEEQPIISTSGVWANCPYRAPDYPNGDTINPIAAAPATNTLVVANSDFCDVHPQLVVVHNNGGNQRAMHDVPIDISDTSGRPIGHGVTDKKGDTSVGTLTPGTYHVVVTGDALSGAVQKVTDSGGGLFGLPVDIGIGVGGGGGGHKGGGGPVGGGGHASGASGGGIGLNVPLSTGGSSSKMSGDGSGVGFVVRIGKMMVLYRIPCCDKTALAGGFNQTIVVPKGMPMPVSVSVLYFKPPKVARK